jgi:hypothetical protein
MRDYYGSTSLALNTAGQTHGIIEPGASNKLDTQSRIFNFFADFDTAKPAIEFLDGSGICA